jgi:hypothetical protein
MLKTGIDLNRNCEYLLIFKTLWIILLSIHFVSENYRGWGEAISRIAYSIIQPHVKTQLCGQTTF